MNNKVPESFLCYLWKFQLVNFPLVSVDNKSIIVKNPGIRNTDGGPDFSNALIKIGETIWAGNVEIHCKSSDWIKHNHHHDRKYENVILHVVLEDDLGPNYESFKPVAVLELKNRFDFKIYSKYQGFIQNKGWIACENYIHQVKELTKVHFLQRIAIERIERKFNLLSVELIKNKSDIEQLFYIQLFRSFGFKTNATPFEMLIKSIPLMVLIKHKDELLKIEALLFGQAGMLDQDFKDDYPNKLKTEYAFLKHKYALSPIQVHLWQYLRLRPSNFPTIRIAQLSVILHQNTSLFSQIIEVESTAELLHMFDISASKYWDTHYHFDKTSKKKIKKLGDKAVESMLINSVIPILFIYGYRTIKPEQSDKALNFLETLKGENNAIIRQWEHLSLPTNNALQTQALIELKTQYCDFKKCLECEFGCELLNK
ncbi:MAG: DUF2851 domain-containing protein [Bacteroidetes bacterium HGW-Bacteroidetes-17]|jgi:phage anti-repressor protein|nr:MAG: DUF2851 domain-containing protein [Bacteroidetes bacterium HGW-Bacteroidetes-17]